MSIIDSSRHPGKADTTKKKKLRKKKEKRNLTSGMKLMPEAPKFLSDILSAIHFDFLNLDVDFGLSDPADTGAVYGYLVPFIYGAPLPSRIMVSLRPDFNQARFAGELETVLHITPAAILPPAFRLAWQVYGPQK